MSRRARHPHQPIIKDKHKIERFKANEIVRYLLDNGGINMNDLAMLPFSDEDRVQFAQLTGYSVCGFSELSYVSNRAFNEATKR